VSDSWSWLTRLTRKPSSLVVASSSLRASHVDIQDLSILIDYLFGQVSHCRRGLAMTGHSGQSWLSWSTRGAVLGIWNRRIQQVSIWVCMQSTCPKSVSHYWRMISPEEFVTCTCQRFCFCLEMKPCHHIFSVRQRHHLSVANEWSAATSYITTSIQRHE